MSGKIYRKKPVEIRAMVYKTNQKTAIAEWAYDLNPDNRIEFIPLCGGGHALKIHTLEGEMTATDGDYIICGVKGEFYPCKPDIFEMTYEEVK